ncbi:MAG: cohesin domain-containing protein, partial [Bacteroidales bacterium]|nr:cohesin domain-containing protein [Bacteroidales bacterium]
MRHLMAFIICISMSLALFSQVDDVTIRIGSDEGIFGSEVVIPVTTDNFNNILSAQGSISFDSDLLDFVGTEQYGLPGLNASSFGTTQTASGFLTFSWYDEMLNGVSLSDGDLLFSIRFEIIDNAAQSTPIQLCGDITPIEVVNSSYNTLTVFDQTGQVTILENPNPGTELSIGFSDHTVEEGQEIIVPVEVTNFNDIVSMQGSILWDETVVTYLSTESYNLPDMSNSNFGTSQAASGKLTFSYNDTDLSGESLADGQSVFSIRFRADGAIGDVTSIFPDNQPTQLEFADISLNPIDYTTIPGSISIESETPGSGMMISADSVEGGIGAIVQVPVRVENFSELIALQGSLEFDHTIVEFDTVIQYGLPSLAYANFGTTNADAGSLSFSWNDPTLLGVTLPQDSAIFVLQFTLIGNIGDISPLNFVQTPTPFECVKSDFTVVNTGFSPGQMEIIDVYELEITNISANEFCAGESFSIDYFAEGNFLPGNIFIAELSDETGDFSSPTLVGDLVGTSSGTFTATLPADLLDGSYSIRLSATQPVYTSETYETAITVHQLPPADAGLDQEICLGETTSFTASGGVDYLWNTGEITDEISANPTVDMEYIVSVTDAFGCENSDTVNLIVHPLPDAQAGADVDICLGETANLSASGGSDYLWSTGENL